MNRADFLKQAYLEGIEKAAKEAKIEGMEKEAFLGALAKALPWLGKGGVAASKVAPAAATKSPGAFGHLKSLFGFGGKGTIGHSLARPLSIIPGVDAAAAHQALGFGTFGGALGALGAEEGDRLGGFARGFGLGTLGGLGWHGGQRGSQAIMKGIANTGGKNVGGFRKALRSVTSAPGKGKQDLQGFGKIWDSGLGPAETAKLLGTRGLYGAGGFGVGMLGSTAVEEQAEKYIPALKHPLSTGVRQTIKAPFAIAQTISRGRYGLTPGASPGSSSGTYSGAQ